MIIQPLFIGTTELIVIGGVALLLFGGKKLPELMHGLGKGVKEFKEGMKDINPPEEECPTPSEQNPSPTTNETGVNEEEPSNE